MIEAEKATEGVPVSRACELLGVSRSGYHKWQTRPPSDQALSDAWLIEKITEIHKDNRGVYGAPRIHAELRLQHGIRVGRKRVERLMRHAGLSGLIPKKRGRTTVRVPGVRSPMTWSNASSGPPRRTCSGSPTSPTCARGRGGSISPLSRTPTAVGSWAGRWPTTCAQSSSPTR